MNTPLLYAILAAIFSGSVPVLAKYGLDVFPSFTLNAIRFFFAALFFLPWMIGKPRHSFSIYKKITFISLIGAFNPIILFIALNYTTASVAPLIYASVPVMAAIYALYRGEKLSLRKWIGIGVGFIGISFIVLLPVFSNNSGELGSIWGNILIFLSAISFFAFSELSRDLMKKEKVSPLEITFYFCIITFFIVLPIGVYSYVQEVAISDITIWHILSGVLAGIVGTSLGYLIYQKALQMSSTLSASLFVFFSPIATTIMAVIILGEKVTIPFLIGGILAIIGAKLASGK